MMYYYSSLLWILAIGCAQNAAGVNTVNPSRSPTSNIPTKSPTKPPSKIPSRLPTKTPIKFPTSIPSRVPSTQPTKLRPSLSPTKNPTSNPSRQPTKAYPSKVPTSSPSNFNCPIEPTTNIVYSAVNGVTNDSLIWTKTFFSWWGLADKTVNVLSLSSKDIQNCNLASYLNLRVFFNPGGNAWTQMSSLGAKGKANIIAFVNRDQSNPSAYVGICAGGFIAATDYIWESMYEGPTYFNTYGNTPTMGIFPHTVEGDINDIGDEQYGDQFGAYMRLVNVSNGHKMIYYGGSTFGWNGVEDYTNPLSTSYDPNVKILLYFTDFYGYYTANIPAAWKYKNVLLSSVHPEAGNCTTVEDKYCPPAGFMKYSDVQRNRAWLIENINMVASTTFVFPTIPVQPAINTTKPHTSYPVQSCYSTGALFCDNFDTDIGKVAYGLSAQFQRNQSYYWYPQPWNTSYISSWYSTTYTSAYSGNGYAVCVPLASPSWYPSTIITRSFDTSICSTSNIKLSYMYIAKTATSGVRGYLSVQTSTNGGLTWTTVSSTSNVLSWTSQSLTLASAKSSKMQIKFLCGAGLDKMYFCAIDSLTVKCA